MKKEYIEISYNGKKSRIHKDLAYVLYTCLCYSQETFSYRDMPMMAKKTDRLLTDFMDEMQHIPLKSIIDK